MRVFLIAVFTVLGLAACNKTDVGTPCSPKEGTKTGGDGKAVIALDLNCEDLKCISTETSATAAFYCSRDCTDDAGACPKGFSCGVLIPAEFTDIPDAGRSFCNRVP